MVKSQVKPGNRCRLGRWNGPKPGLGLLLILVVGVLDAGGQGGSTNGGLAGAPGFVLAQAPPVAIVPPRPLVHPSVLNSEQELDRIRHRVYWEPGSVAALGWSRLRASSYASLAYQHLAYSNVVVVGSGTCSSETQYRNDGQAAWAHALQWAITGDGRHRDKALAIMNDWAGTFVLMSPASGTSSSQLQLEAAWYAPVWVAAADILRYFHRGAAGWASHDIARFDAMLDYLHGKAAQAAARNNNWGASAALAMIAVGAYQENQARFDAGIQAWRDNLVKVNAAVSNNGFINEVCRDTIHPQYTLQVWMQAAEIAWKNEIDLYGMAFSGSAVPQLAINLENFARLFLGRALPPCDSAFLAKYDYVGAQSHSGAYDIAFNHYVLRMGSTGLPHYSDLVINHWRPGGVDGHFNPWSTLTHGHLSEGIPAVSALGIWNPASNAFARMLSEGDTLNLRSLGGLALGVETAGTVSSAQFLTNGVPMGSGVTGPAFAAGDWLLPGNHFVQVVPIQDRTGGGIPGDPFTCFLRVVDLPPPWAVHEIGQPVVPAWGSEAGGIFGFSTAGTNASGVADQCGFLALPIAGDVQVTARVGSVRFGQPGVQAGLMIREGLGAGDRQVFLSLAGTDLNVARFCFRSVQPGNAIVWSSAAPSGAAWLRLARFGNSFSGYYSTDGQTWVAFGSAGIAMKAEVHAGLAAASGSSRSPAAVSFDKVLVEPLKASFDEWRQWTLVSRGATNAAIEAPEADPDGDERSNWMEYHCGSDPLVADVEPWLAVAGLVDGAAVNLRSTERKNADDFGRRYYHSTDLAVWAPIMPETTVQVQDRGSVVVRECTFPIRADAGYYRVGYDP